MTGTDRQVPARPSARGDEAGARDQVLSERAVLAPTDELRILLVEDDDGDAILVEELLSDGDLTVELHRATTLDAALEMLASRPVDCVLLDLGLPDSVGLSAVERVRTGTH
ncbi:response regulator, partial [Cellulosimicrobium sp. I38E]